jgi:SAM-dependent methyltransferase
MTDDAANGNASKFPPEWFAREDESPDPDFYVEPRLVVHIDDETIEAVRAYLAGVLPADGRVLDLMSAWRSHLPHDFAGSVVGVGMNDAELAANPQLDEHLVHDLNANPRLPLADNHFDAAFVVVSIQYMTRPVEIFTDVCRVLKPGAAFHVIFSERMFPTKAVTIWRALTGPQKRAELIAAYFGASEGWTQPTFVDRSPGGADPAYVVHAAKVG